MVYIKNFGTPMRRADTNSALERHLFWQANFPDVPELSQFRVKYGEKREIPTMDEVNKKMAAYVAARKRQLGISE